MKTGNESYELSEIIYQLERQYPLMPSTFSTCECQRHMARGGGLCSECLEEKLAEKVGKGLAWELHHSFKQYQRIKSEVIYGE
jgi:hypothetical protein